MKYIILAVSLFFVSQSVYATDPHRYCVQLAIYAEESAKFRNQGNSKGQVQYYLARNLRDQGYSPQVVNDARHSVELAFSLAHFTPYQVGRRAYSECMREYQNF